MDELLPQVDDFWEKLGLVDVIENHHKDNEIANTFENEDLFEEKMNGKESEKESDNYQMDTDFCGEY